MSFWVWLDIIKECTIVLALCLKRANFENNFDGKNV